MIKYLIFFLIPLSISVALTPLVRIVSKKLKIYDFPSKIKVHKKPIPLLGGVPIFIAFNVTFAIGYLLGNSYVRDFLNTRGYVFIFCQLVILFMGIIDDIRKLKPIYKFIIQIFVGLLLVLNGFNIARLTNPFTGEVINLGVFSVVLTIVWVVAITNALNLIDGLDGLAAGTAFIVSGAIFGISFFGQNGHIALVSLILAGSVLGFLFFNFYPAKIFLGDSGSMLLGFLLAVISIESSSKGATFTMLALILALGLPIMETLLSIVRRFLKGFSIFKADKDHIHHRLLKLGLSHKKAVIFLYGITIVFCSLSFVVVIFQDLNRTLFLAAIFGAVLIGIKGLNYSELKVFRNKLEDRERQEKSGKAGKTG